MWDFIYDDIDSHIIWVSEGLCSVHVMVIPTSDTTEKENGESSNDGEIIHSSGLYTFIFNLLVEYYILAFSH